MYIKNISEMLKDQLPIRFKLTEGSTIYGKIISLDEGKGTIKLYDGTLLPAIFISDNQLEKNKYKKFQIMGFEDDNILIRLVDNDAQTLKETSIDNVLQNLNVPKEEGKKIIASLMKFNQYAGDENVLKIYKNLSFIKNFTNMNDSDILAFLKDTFNKDFDASSPEFSAAKELITILKDVDADFFSFMIENDVPTTLTNVLVTKDFIDEKFFMNTLIDKFCKALNIENMDNSQLSLDNILEKIKGEPDILRKVPIEFLNKLSSNTDILNYVNSNYSIYLFNYYAQNNLFKNNIIIKNKYKNSKYIDVNNAKVFVTVDTPKTGTVEAYLIKKNNDLIITLKVEKDYLSLYKGQLRLLEDSLKDKGYTLINIGVEKLQKDVNFVNLSDFFNDTIFKELDVKV